MTRSTDIQDELQELGSQLAGQPSTVPYKVPAGYFEQLADGVLFRIKTSNENLDSDREIKALSPLLAGIGKKAPFSVPDGYFENLGANAARVTETGRVIDINRNQPARRLISLPASKVLRYAVAAVTVGILFVASWFFLKEPAPAGQLAAKDSTTAQPLNLKIENISENEIASYLENSTVYPGDNGLAAEGEVATTDIQLMFQDVSDGELEQYLNLNQPAREKFN